MLGLRGVRLGLVIPGLFAMQVRAIAEAAGAAGRRRAATRRPEIMIPLVGASRSSSWSASEAREVLAEVAPRDRHATLQSRSAR